MFSLSVSLLVWYVAVAIIARHSLEHYTHKLSLLPYYLNCSMLLLFSLLYLNILFEELPASVKISDMIFSLVDANYFLIISVTCLEWNLLTMLVRFQSRTTAAEVSIKREEHFARERILIKFWIVGTILVIAFEPVYIIFIWACPKESDICNSK